MNPAALLSNALGVCPDFVREELPVADVGFPRGAISEITGPESSGRSTLAHALLATATQRLEICAYVDADDAFDPATAAAGGVALEQLVWIRCAHNTEHALKAADALLQAGGFGVVVLDLCRIQARTANRIPLSYWYRFRHAVENTPTVLALLERQPLAKSCAGLIVEMQRTQAAWPGARGFEILSSMNVAAVPRKPLRAITAQIQAKAVG